MKILIVENEDIIRKLMARVLRNLKVDVDEAENGQVALKKIRQDPIGYNLIITDLNMPNMNGLELIECILKDNVRVPIVLMTGGASESERAQAEQLENSKQINQFVEKPLTVQQIRDLLKVAKQD